MLFFSNWMSVHAFPFFPVLNGSQRRGDRGGYDMQQKPLAKTQCNYTVRHLPSSPLGSLLFLRKRVLTLDFHQSIIYSGLSCAEAYQTGTYPTTSRTVEDMSALKKRQNMDLHWANLDFHLLKYHQNNHIGLSICAKTGNMRKWVACYIFLGGR